MSLAELSNGALDYIARRKIMVTGCPKSGTHWVAGIVRGCGWNVSHIHQPWANFTEIPIICVFRHPRDMIVSMCRHRGSKPEPKTVASYIEGFYNGDIVSNYRSYLGYWTTDNPNIFCVRFEDLAKGDVPSPDTPTRTSEHSRWQRHWGFRCERLYKKVGGFDLERDLTDLGIID